MSLSQVKYYKCSKLCMLTEKIKEWQFIFKNPSILLKLKACHEKSV